MTYPVKLKSKIFYIPLILASLVASFYLLGIIWNFLSNFSSLFYILIAAWIIAIILKPVVQYISKAGVNPIAAIAIAFILLFGIIVVIGIFVIPSLYYELNLLAKNLSSLDLNAYVQPVLDKLHVRNVDITNELVSYLNSILTYTISNSISVLENIVAIVFGLVIAFFFAFYFLYEGHKWQLYIGKLIPAQFIDDYDLLIKSISEGLQGFFRGQAVIALILSVTTMIAMKLLGLDLVIVSGVFVFIAMFIPIVGPAIAVILPLVIASTVSINAFIILLAILIVLIQVDVNIIQPKIFSKSLGLHPVLVVIAVLIGGQLFGFIGALLALPAAYIIQSLLIHYYSLRND